jgi:hypothetical protein
MCECFIASEIICTSKLGQVKAFIRKTEEVGWLVVIFCVAASSFTSEEYYRRTDRHGINKPF